MSRVQGGRQRVVVAFVQGRLPLLPVREGQPHAVVDPPESSAFKFIRHSSAEACRNKGGLELEEEGSPKDQQGERVWWCYNSYYRYDKHCTTAYKWHYSDGHGTAKNDNEKPKFNGAFYTPPKPSGTAAPVTPPKAPAYDKGKPSAKGKSKTSDDAGKGKSKSKGDSHREKGKAKGTHCGKGKGQK